MSGQINLEAFLRTGQVVGGHYRVQNLLAKGGMAAVWAAVNEHTGKRVALKVILQSFAKNSDAAELFRREALTASKVNHPSVVNIFDVIDHAGMTCIVMELLEGETLGNYLAKKGPLSLETTLTLLLPAMGGVAAVNAQGVVHRDLKPGNIFLCCGSDGGILTTKVLDFGISVMMRHAGEAAPATELATMLGTPAYMAPEAIGFSPDIDGRADVYGFGVLFFEALTGKVPFIGPPGLDLLERILNDPPPLVTLYRPDLPSDVVNLIACALAKNPKDRFADMAHFIRAVEDCLLPLLPSPRSLTPISGSSMAETAVPHLPAPSPLPKVGVAPTSRRQASRDGHRHFPGRRVAVGAAVAAVLTVTIWVFAPGVLSGDGVAQGPSPIHPTAAVRMLRPLVAVAPIALAPAPPPAVVPKIIEVVVGVPEISLHRSVQHASPHVARPPRPPARMSDRTPAPRAGRLSQSDF